jgi:predicted MFS family arabinose efflux permease
MIIDVATFFAAVIGTLTIKPLNQENEEALLHENKETPEDKKESYISQLKDGITYVTGNKVLINYGIMVIFINFLLVPLNSLQAPIAEDVFGLGSGLLSVMGMAASLGGILGSVITPMVIDKISAKRTLISCGVIMGSFLYALSLGRFLHGLAIPGMILATVCYFMMSFAASLLGGTVMIQFVKTCRKDYLARASAVMGATSTAAMPLGSIIVSFAAMHMSPAVLIEVCGIMAVLFMIAIGFSNMDFELVKKETVDAT